MLNVVGNLLVAILILIKSFPLVRNFDFEDGYFVIERIQDNHTKEELNHLLTMEGSHQLEAYIFAISFPLLTLEG